jgi:hypothetical protein
MNFRLPKSFRKCQPPENRKENHPFVCDTHATLGGHQTDKMRGVVVLGPRGVLTVAAVLLLQSGIIGYLLYRTASGLDDCTDLPGLGRPLPLDFLPPQQQHPPPLGPDDGRGPRDAPPSPAFDKKVHFISIYL